MFEFEKVTSRNETHNKYYFQLVMQKQKFCTFGHTTSADYLNLLVLRTTCKLNKIITEIIFSLICFSSLLSN